MKNGKPFLLFLVVISTLFINSCVSNAVTWKEVVDFGGIKIGDIHLGNNRYNISIECDGTGLTEIANKPNEFTSAPLFYYRASSKLIDENKIGIKLYKKLIMHGENISEIILPRFVKKGTYSIGYLDKDGSFIYIKNIVIE